MGLGCLGGRGPGLGNFRREGSSRPWFLDLVSQDGVLPASAAVVPGPGSRNSTAWEGRNREGETEANQ